MNEQRDAIAKFHKRHVDFQSIVLLTYHPVEDDFSRIEFGTAVQDMLNQKRITMLYHIIAEEVSVGTPRHLHMAIKFKSPVSVSGLVQLFESNGFHIDVTSGANNYQIYYQYLYIPSIKKPMECLDPAPRLSRNHPAIKVTDDNKRLASTRINFESFFILVSENKLQTTDQLFEYIANLEDITEKKQMATFLSRRPNDIQADLDLINRCCGTPRTKPSRLQLLSNSRYLQCECDGTLKDCNDFILQNSNVDIGAFCTKTLEALVLGAGRGRCVGLIGPSRCGKTSVLSSIELIVGMENIFTTPISGTTAPLLNLPNTLICLLNDFYFTPGSRVSWHDMLLWFEGIQFKIGSPRNISCTDILYSGENPVFMTSGEPIRMKEHSTERGNNMMDERMVYFYFQNPIPKDHVKPYRKCGKCFWEWVTERAVECQNLLIDNLPVPQLPAEKPEGVSRSVWKTIKNHHNKRVKEIESRKKVRKNGLRMGSLKKTIEKA